MSLLKVFVKNFSESFDSTFKPEVINEGVNNIRETLGKEPVETLKTTKDKNKDKYNFNF